MKEQVKEAIREAVDAAVREGAFAEAEWPQVILDVPPQKEFGDFATNFAMQAAKVAKTNPRKIAQEIVKRLNKSWLEKAEIAGPGFINFYLKPDWLHDLLGDILRLGENYGKAPTLSGPKIQIEFVSANPTGPLHVGHGRGAAVGSALANLLRAAGYDVQTEYYINDAGNQIDKLAESVNARYLELLHQPAIFPEDGYHGHDIVETAERIIKHDGDRYLNLSEKDRLGFFKELALKEKLAAVKEDLEAFGVTFDVWFSEKSLHEKLELTSTCKVLQDRHYIYEKEGALWLKSTAFGDDKDRVVIRDNGVPTYLAADIAYHKNKLERGFNKIINIWGADHHGYICRVKAALEALGYNPEALEILILQMVNLYQNGELVKMSKRTGQGVTLNELVEEVGKDAARYFFIMRSIDSQLDFDLDLAKSHSNENPVYYIQYAHARISSIFKQAKEAGIEISNAQGANLSLLSTEAELNLIKKLGDLPEEVSQAAKERAPHYIARYAHELASLFHTFYNQCRIIGVDPDLQEARIALVRAVWYVLRQVLGILGIHAPERM